MLVIIGWGIINRQHNIREDRKETRASIDRVKSYSYELETASIKAHMSNEITSDDATCINWKIKKLIDEIEYAALLSNEERNAHAKMLRRSITLSNLDPSSHCAVSEQDKIIRDTRTAIDDLVSAIEKTFRGRYPLAK
ncbi:hypothetical protein FEF65_03975 [Mariprofundus erugo]|uniref:Uncharacterized protein n=1 Tax=Mariprofundus erugo TaxID=2528639 RepID=A0A5R9GW30_9PROT|nr:hypothetical protein [Mariprofundus erugo]TLS68162.1 hypothetical protein FEF65_03975 [Mariprofundus erugo]